MMCTQNCTGGKRIERNKEKRKKNGLDENKKEFLEIVYNTRNQTSGNNVKTQRLRELVRE